MFAEYYQDYGPLELFKHTGDNKYLSVVLDNVPLSASIGTFPTHNIPPIIEINIELYRTTNNETRKEAAINVGNALVNWIVANNYYIYGGLEGDLPYISIDNFWHSVLALLRLSELIDVPNWKLTVNSNLSVPLKINSEFTCHIPATVVEKEGKHVISIPMEVKT
jgi:hypothetical protein